jgi:hypothetical protein
MLNDPHSLGTSLAKILTVMNVNVNSDIIRHSGLDLDILPSTKHDWLIIWFPLRMFDHTIAEKFILEHPR